MNGPAALVFSSMIPDVGPYLPGLIFLVLSALSILGGMLAAFAPKIVHAAFGLMAAFFGVAGIYALLGADVLALVQVIVYVGGILILLVFGVLLTGRAKGQLGLESRRPTWPWALILGAVLLVGLSWALFKTEFHSSGATLSTLPEPQGTTVGGLGRALLAPDQYLYPFEFVSVFLLLALVGAAYLVRRKRPTP